MTGGKENRISSGDPRFGFISMARMLTGIRYPINQAGLDEAVVALRAQNERVRLLVPAATLRRMIVEKDPIIKTTEEQAMQAIHDGDYEAALQSSNLLYAYGDTDNKDSLGGEAFALSLGVHRLFAGIIVGRYLNEDPFLMTKWLRIAPDIQEAEKAGNTARELDLLRSAIHMAALNGTLGEGAKEYFDPFPLGPIE